MTSKKYLVLFTPESIDPGDDSMQGTWAKMLFAYPEDKNCWAFDTAEAAHKEAMDNEYRPGIDYVVVRVLANPKGKKHEA